MVAPSSHLSSLLVQLAFSTAPVVRTQLALTLPVPHAVCFHRPLSLIGHSPILLTMSHLPTVLTPLAVLHLLAVLALMVAALSVVALAVVLVALVVSPFSGLAVVVALVVLIHGSLLSLWHTALRLSVRSTHVVLLLVPGPVSQSRVKVRSESHKVISSVRPQTVPVTDAPRCVPGSVESGRGSVRLARAVRHGW